MTNWPELTALSHYKSAAAIREALQRGDIADATEGIEELLDALSRSDRRALYSQLVRLMKHVMKWHVQPGFRSKSWRNTILHAREMIADIREDNPSLTVAVVREMWERAVRQAHREAEEETGVDFPVPDLGWNEVFEVEYRV